MGTNYTLHIDACQHCQRSQHNLHIGKLSGGWMFLFRYHPKEPWAGTFARCWAEWVKLITARDNVVVDEYGKEMDGEVFLDQCRASQRGDAKSQWAEYRNDYRPGQIYYDEGFTLIVPEFS